MSPQHIDELPDVPFQPARILATLAEHDVDYVTIGGLAVQAHGHIRATGDVDILAAPDEANLARLASALRELDARLLGVDAHLLGIDPTDPEHLRGGANFTLQTRHGRLDLWTDTDELAGAAEWPTIRARALQVEVQGAPMRYVSLDDLIAMKRAAGRPRDLTDISALTDPAGRFERRDRGDDSGRT